MAELMDLMPIGVGVEVGKYDNSHTAWVRQCSRGIET